MPDDSNPVGPGSMMPGDPPPRPLDAIAPGAPVVRPGADGLREGRPEIVLNPKAATRAAPDPKEGRRARKRPRPRTASARWSRRSSSSSCWSSCSRRFWPRLSSSRPGRWPPRSWATTARCAVKSADTRPGQRQQREHDPQEPHPQHVVSCTCPNCEFTNRIAGPRPGGGR